jgi:HSP20 family protein
MLNTISSNDIRQTLDHFRRSVDQMFDNFYGYPADRSRTGSNEAANWSFSPVLETGWTDNSIHLRAVLPGVSQGDVNVNLTGNQLVITGERKLPEGLHKNGFTHLAYGKFTTSVTLPAGLDVEKINCRLQDGVLDIAIPVAESMKPRQIPIQADAQQKSLGA